MPPSQVPLAPGEPYSGLAYVADEVGGLRITAVGAGPAAQAGLRKDDRILAVDGLPLTASDLDTRLRDARVGAPLLLRIVRQGEPLQVTLRPGRRDEWRGPADEAAAGLLSVAQSTPPRWIAAVREDLAGAAPALGADAVSLARMFAALANDPRGPNWSPLARASFATPAAALGELERGLDAWRAASARPFALTERLCAWWAATCARAPDATAYTEPKAYASAIAVLAAEVRSHIDARLVRGRSAALTDLDYLAAETARARLIHAQPEALQALRAMRDSRHFDGSQLLPYFARLLALAAAAPRPDGPARTPSRARSAHVEGTLLAAIDTPAGAVVFGAQGPNRYRMDGLLAVVDVGGDDVYVWGETAPAAVQVIVDLAGDDRYRAARGGPGAAWFGVAVTFDAAGDDDYRARLGGCGAGLYGLGLLLDGAGKDRYRCDRWSLGAGLYGAGLSIDSGADGDIYRSQMLGQGVGGPGGIGVLMDEGGADLYRANGPLPSVYGTPATYVAFSQGVGYGLRPFDQGGFGLLLDGGGDDRYEGGEFAQGGGYFGGLGVLADAGGDDLYYGQHYAQGFAAHQAVGVLADYGGDDHYWAAGAAAQGAAWDQGLALLYDAAGDDDYRGGELAQGAAAHQAAALLYDAAGDDTYRSRSALAQGAVGGNGYHFHENDPVASLGVLYDAAGGDRYTSGLGAGELRVRRAAATTRAVDGIVGVARDHDTGEPPRR